MSVVVEIFFKVLLYSLIMLVVRNVIAKIQNVPKEILATEWGERVITQKVFSLVYLIVAIGFTIILVIITSFPTNLETVSYIVVMVCFVGLILLFLAQSFMYGRIYVKIGKEMIQWRGKIGKEGKINYDDISSAKIDANGNVTLYRGTECVVQFATGNHKVFVEEVLKNHKISLNGDMSISEFQMFPGIGYKIFDFVCLLIFVIFFLASVYYSMIEGILFFAICSIAGVFNLFVRIRARIVVENNRIIEHKFLRKNKEILFNQVKGLEIKKGNNTEIICVLSDSGSTIKIPKYYKNVENFEMLIKKRRWKYL